jgi:hypothetical protein
MMSGDLVPSKSSALTDEEARDLRLGQGRLTMINEHFGRRSSSRPSSPCPETGAAASLRPDEKESAIGSHDLNGFQVRAIWRT